MIFVLDLKLKDKDEKYNKITLLRFFINKENTVGYCYQNSLTKFSIINSVFTVHYIEILGYLVKNIT